MHFSIKKLGKGFETKTHVWVLALTCLVASAHATAHPVTYSGTLSNLGEPSPAEQSLGTGVATVILNEDDFTMRVMVDFSNLTGQTSAAHIHCCTLGAGSGNAGVAMTLPSFPGFPLGVQSGSYDTTFDMTQTGSWNPAFVSANGNISSAFAALATGIAAGKAYFNIHTTFVPGGEIRAFLSPAPVPLPAAMWLLMPALGGLGLLRKRAA